MAYRNKTYVAFDGTNDIRYYRLMQAWRAKDSSSFNFYDAHDINSARDSSLEQSIKRQLTERMNNSKVFVLLIGSNTRYLTKFVKWEVETALRQELPIICVNLNGSYQKDSLCPSYLNNKLALFIPFNQEMMQRSLDQWPGLHYQKLRQNETAAYSYSE